MRTGMFVGMLFGLGASASWALANVAVQRAGRAVGSVPALLWVQALGVLVAVLGAAALGERPRLPDATTVGWIAVAGVAGLGGYFCLFYAFEHGRLTLAVPILSSWAVLSSALSLVLFHDRPTPGQWVGAAVVIAGAVVVARWAQRDDGGERGAARGHWLWAALGGAIGFGVLIPTMRRLSPTFGPVGTVGVVYAADLALALPILLALRLRPVTTRPSSLRRGTPAGAWPAILLAAFFETAGSACITLGARRAPLSIVSPLASLAATLTVLYAWAVLHERPSRGVLVGAALVSAGVVVLAL